MDLDELAAAWRHRADRHQAEHLERAQRARASARCAAAILRHEFDAEQVWLFGSLLTQPRHDKFDIDLAVRGLRPDLYFAALARVHDVATEPVDLIPLESAGDRLRATIHATAESIGDE